MSRQLKLALIVLVPLGLIGALVVFLLTRVDAKSRFEAIMAETTGLEVAVKGNVAVGLFPTPHVALKEVTLRNGELQIASLSEADASVALWPLLRGLVEIQRLVLRDVNIEVERDRNGHLNIAKPSQTSRPMPAMSLGRLSFAKASFRYINRQSDSQFTAVDCNVDSDNVQLAAGNSADIMGRLALSGHGACAEVRNDQFVGAGVDFSFAGQRGVFKLKPVSMQMMGGKGSGIIDADFTGEIPAYQVHYAVTQLHVEDLFKSLAPRRVGEGFLDFTADLSMRGSSAIEMTRTAKGEASLRGKDLMIAIGNLDEQLSNYESSQNFNLVDVGAFLIVGPLGAVATKGYDFASNFQGTEGNTKIHVFVSDWRVQNGVAHAHDVAMATKENRLAMKGALDFVNKDFDDVTIAILDNQGCARVEQRIRGPFSKPEVEKPNVFASLTGPIRRLIGKAGKLLGAKCDVFYKGSVQP